VATLRQRGNRFQAIVRLSGTRPIYRSFATEAAAKRWAEAEENRQRLTVEADPGALKLYTLVDLIERYHREPPTPKGLSRHRVTVFRTLSESALGKLTLDRLNRAAIIAFARWREKAHGVGPATILMDLVVLGDLLRSANDYWNLPLGTAIEEFKAARNILRRGRQIARSRERNRRVTAAELEALYLYWQSPRHRRMCTPMRDIVEFALETAMRLGEICRAAWADVDELRRTLTIRDRKHPSKKEGNSDTIPLLGTSWDILQRQPRIEEDPRIFAGTNERSVSTNFSRAVLRCGIADLVFHDLRHEAISRLFERGYGIAEVAVVSGHRDWNQLRRYTAIRPESLHDGPAGRR
jgi:integrase